jgi:hypothetical protein
MTNARSENGNHHVMNFWICLEVVVLYSNGDENTCEHARRHAYDGIRVYDAIDQEFGLDTNKNVLSHHFETIMNERHHRDHPDGITCFVDHLENAFIELESFEEKHSDRKKFQFLKRSLLLLVDRKKFQFLKRSLVLLVLVLLWPTTFYGSNWPDGWSLRVPLLWKSKQFQEELPMVSRKGCSSRAQ